MTPGPALDRFVLARRTGTYQPTGGTARWMLAAQPTRRWRSFFWTSPRPYRSPPPN